MAEAITAIEKELIEATGFKMKRFNNRQDYLAAVARAAEGLENDDFENLSDDSAEWYDKAASAINSNEDIPEFKAVTAGGDDEEEAEDEAEAKDDAEEEAEDEEGDPTDDNPEADPDEDDDEAEGEDEGEAEAEEDEAEPEEVAAKPAKKAKAKATPVAAPVTKAKGKVIGKAKTKVVEAEEAEEDEAPPPRKPVPVDPELVKKFQAKKAAEDKKKGRKDSLPKTRYDEISGTKNRFGYYEGTKTDEAIGMFVKGAKMSEVRDYLGDTFYNVLRKLRDKGHMVEKTTDGKLKLIHMADIKRSGGNGKKAKNDD